MEHGRLSRRRGTVLDSTPRCADIAVHLPMVLTELGFLAELRGDPHTAFRLHDEAYDLARKIGAPRDTAQALEGLAAAGSPAAATVLGAAAAARTAAKLPTAPAERADVDRATTTALATLGRPAFTEELEAGSRLTPDEARTRAVHALFGCAPGHREAEPLPRHSRPT